MTDTDGQNLDVSRLSVVEYTAEPQRMIGVLDAAKRMPGFAATAELLDELGTDCASSSLDVGCGYGADVIELASA